MLLRNAIGALALVGAIAVTPAFAQSTADAEAAVDAWLNAVVVGTPEALDAILAPEFQIQRSNGVGHDKTGYIEGGAAALTDYEVRDIVATRDGDTMVVRYTLVVSETISGAPVEQTAPRLTVFRLDGDTWLVVAHANFAQIE